MKAMLVYQYGIANVFEVKCFNLNKFGRSAKRLYQGDFISARNIAYGIGLAGGIVRTANCDKVGDITREQWEDLTSDAVFSDKKLEVSCN